MVFRYTRHDFRPGELVDASFFSVGAPGAAFAPPGGKCCEFRRPRCCVRSSAENCDVSLRSPATLLIASLEGGGRMPGGVGRRDGTPWAFGWLLRKEVNADLQKHVGLAQFCRKHGQPHKRINRIQYKREREREGGKRSLVTYGTVEVPQNANNWPHLPAAHRQRPASSLSRASAVAVARGDPPPGVARWRTWPAAASLQGVQPDVWLLEREEGNLSTSKNLKQ